MAKKRTCVEASLRIWIGGGPPTRQKQTSEFLPLHLNTPPLNQCHGFVEHRPIRLLRDSPSSEPGRKGSFALLTQFCELLKDNRDCDAHNLKNTLNSAFSQSS